MRAPTHLRKDTKSWWQAIVAEYVLEPHHLRLLTLAGEAYDAAVQARERLQADGSYYMSQSGEPRKHPAIGVQRDSMIAYARLMRELDLDGAPEPDTRPPRIRSRT